LGLAFAQQPLSGWRGQDVQHDAQRHGSIQQEGEDRTQHRALGGQGFGHGHHQHHVDPGNGNQIHIVIRVIILLSENWRHRVVSRRA